MNLHSRIAVAALGAIAIGLVGPERTQGGMITVSPATPTVDDADIAMLNSAGQFDPGGNEGHIWFNRPVQGQTFTTGAEPAGYILSSVTLQNEENSINNNTATFTVRIGAVSGSTFTPIASETSNNAISYVPNDYMTFQFADPVVLAPNTLYGFDWTSSGSGFTTWANGNANYASGEGFSSGAGGTPNDANLLFRGVDRIFHVNLAVVTPEPASAGLVLFATLALGARRRFARS